MDYANDPDDEEIAGVSGDTNPEWQNLLHLRGWNRMLAGIRAIPGSSIEPAIHGYDCERTGIYFEEDSVCVAIEGLPRGRWDVDGLHLIATSGSVDMVTPGAFLKTNAEAFTVYAGQPVKLSGASSFALAQANSFANRAVGLAAENIATGAEGLIIRSGVLEVADWTSALGSAALTTDTEYLLKQSSAGLLDSSAPTGSGDLVQHLGKAIGTTRLFVGVHHPWIQ
jgi:hypothetical protein